MFGLDPELVARDLGRLLLLFAFLFLLLYMRRRLMNGWQIRRTGDPKSIRRVLGSCEDDVNNAEHR